MTIGSFPFNRNNGSLESCVKTKEIKVTTLPLKTDYTDTEIFDPTGIIVTAVDLNGNETEITDYTYDKYVIIESSVHEIHIIFTYHHLTRLMLLASRGAYPFLYAVMIASASEAVSIVNIKCVMHSPARRSSSALSAI